MKKPRERAAVAYDAVCESIARIVEHPFPDLETACRQKIMPGLDWVDSCMELEVVQEFLERIVKRQKENA